MDLTITHQNTTPGPGNLVAAADWTASHALEGDYLRKATVTLSSAQLLDLHNTPITLVAAPGAGKWINPHRCSAWIDYGTTPYVAGDGMYLYYGADQYFAGPDFSALVNSESVLSQNTTLGPSVAWDLLSNLPVVITAVGVAITGGDSPIHLTLWYSIEDVP